MRRRRRSRRGRNSLTVTSILLRWARWWSGCRGRRLMPTRFVPPASWRAKVAPTQYDENEHMLRGVVHDPTARRMGGVAGHAGLFSTAADLSIFCRMLLDGGAVGTSRVLSTLTVSRMTAPATSAAEPNVRGLGWDLDSVYSANRGELLPLGSFGHTGFTGTSLWIDPATRTYIVFLSNRVHP